MKMKELQQLGKEELQKKMQESEMELMKLNMQVATGTQIKNPGQIKHIKKTIARIEMLLQESVKSDGR